MAKRRIKDYPYYHPEQMRQHILDNVDIEAFDRHCQQVADNVGVDKIVVRELLLDHAHVTLSLLQVHALRKRCIKINIAGFISFVTTRIKDPIVRPSKLKT